MVLNGVLFPSIAQQFINNQTDGQRERTADNQKATPNQQTPLSIFNLNPLNLGFDFGLGFSFGLGSPGSLESQPFINPTAGPAGLEGPIDGPGLTPATGIAGPINFPGFQLPEPQPFDIEAALELIASDPEGDGAKLIAALEARGTEILRGPLPANFGGFFERSTNQIVLNDQLNESDSLAVLIHEILHAVTPDDGNSKLEEGANNIITDRIFNRIVDTESPDFVPGESFPTFALADGEENNAVELFNATVAEYPDLEENNQNADRFGARPPGSYIESLASIGIDINDFFNFADFLEPVNPEALSADGVVRLEGGTGIVPLGDGDDEYRAQLTDSTLAVDAGDGSDVVRVDAEGSAVSVVAGDGADATSVIAADNSVALVNAGDGSDLTVLEASNGSSVTGQAGPGDDFSVVTAENSTVEFGSGQGNDQTVLIGNDSDVTLRSGNGIDSVEVRELTGGQTQISTGEDTDIVNVFQSVDAEIAIATGNGDDIVGLGLQLGGAAAIDTGDGDDLAEVIAQNGGATAIDTGEGNDVATVLNLQDGSTAINTGDGNDIIRIGMTPANGFFSDGVVENAVIELNPGDGIDQIIIGPNVTGTTFILDESARDATFVNLSNPFDNTFVFPPSVVEEPATEGQDNPTNAVASDVADTTSVTGSTEMTDAIETMATMPSMESTIVQQNLNIVSPAETSTAAVKEDPRVRTLVENLPQGLLDANQSEQLVQALNRPDPQDGLPALFGVRANNQDRFDQELGTMINNILGFDARENDRDQLTFAIRDIATVIASTSPDATEETLMRRMGEIYI